MSDIASSNTPQKGVIHSYWDIVIRAKEPDSETDLSGMRAALDTWSPSEDTLDDLFTLSQRSLSEVTHLTEYEDEKANRILTAMAFLSALAAVLIASFVSEYHTTLSGAAGIKWGVLATVYALFFVYITTLVLGAIFVVSALKPRFNIPPQWGSETGKPSSFLFFERIIKLSPESWAKAFSSAPADLKREYIKNSIFETYLIAEKVQDKLARLTRGVNLLWQSTRLLLLWVIVYTLTVVFIPAEEQESQLAVRLRQAEAQLVDFKSDVQEMNQRLADHNRAISQTREELGSIETDLARRREKEPVKDLKSQVGEAKDKRLPALQGAEKEAGQPHAQ